MGWSKTRRLDCPARMPTVTGAFDADLKDERMTASCAKMGLENSAIASRAANSPEIGRGALMARTVGVQLNIFYLFNKRMRRLWEFYGAFLRALENFHGRAGLG